MTCVWCGTPSHQRHQAKKNTSKYKDLHLLKIKAFWVSKFEVCLKKAPQKPELAPFSMLFFFSSAQTRPCAGWIDGPCGRPRWGGVHPPPPGIWGGRVDPPPWHPQGKPSNISNMGRQGGYRSPHRGGIDIGELQEHHGKLRNNCGKNAEIVILGINTLLLEKT